MTESQPRAAMAWPALGAGLLLMVGITAYPLVLVGKGGKADHVAAMLAAWGMCAGLVRGVGFIPRTPVLRLLMSGPACAVALLILSALLTSVF